MIGCIDPRLPHVTIIGGGISGLLAAFDLDQKGYEVHLYEANQRVGGLIHTDVSKWGISESAAHSILASTEVQVLFKKLGIGLTPSRRKQRFVVRNGQLSRFPLKAADLAVMLHRMIFRRFLSQALTLEVWTDRHLGQIPLRYLISPMVQGIYAASPKELQVDLVFPKWQGKPGSTLFRHIFFGILKKIFKIRRNSLPKARTVMCTPAAGMGSVVAALERVLRARLGNRFHVGEKVSSLPKSSNVILCVPAHSAAELLDSTDSISAEALRQVQYAPLVSVTVFCKKEDFTKVPEGIGVLIPKVEKKRTLGVLFNSSSFSGRVADEDSMLSLTAMLGGTEDPGAVSKSDIEILSEIKADLRDLFGFTGDFANAQIHRWEKAIPVYSPQLKATWEILSKEWCGQSGKVLFSNYSGQVSIRGLIESLSYFPAYVSTLRD